MCSKGPRTLFVAVYPFTMALTMAYKIRIGIKHAAYKGKYRAGPVLLICTIHIGSEGDG